MTKYPLDGVFFNMIGFPQNGLQPRLSRYLPMRELQEIVQGVLRPGAASARWRRQRRWRKLKAWQRIQIDTQFRRVRELVKSIRPDIAICTYTEEHIDVIRKESGQPTGEGHWGNFERAQSTLLNNPTRQLANASVHFHQMIFRHSGVAPHLHTRRLWQ